MKLVIGIYSSNYITKRICQGLKPQINPWFFPFFVETQATVATFHQQKSLVGSNKQLLFLGYGPHPQTLTNNLNMWTLQFLACGNLMPTPPLAPWRSCENLCVSHGFRKRIESQLKNHHTYPWKFNSLPLKIYHPKRKGSSLHHHFSRAIYHMLNFGCITKKQ